MGVWPELTVGFGVGAWTAIPPRLE